MIAALGVLTCAMIKTKLVDKLFEGPIDIIGDIHGESWQDWSPTKGRNSVLIQE